MSEETKYELVKFIDNELELEVSVSPKEETIWMSQEQIVKLFNTSKQNISLHISNILKSGELEYSTVKENLTVQYEGERKIKRKIKLYNLEMIISVGYRVRSKRGKDRKTITRHIQNILKEFKLKEKQVCSKNEHTALDGKKYIVKIYNLDIIIAVGYRVKSNIGVKFIDDNIELDVSIDPYSETIWLTQSQMSILFGVDISRISRHIKNALNEEEINSQRNLRETQITN